MIALRGTLQHITQKKPAQACPQVGKITEIDFNPLDTKEGDWIWTGHWATGSLPDDSLITLSNKKKKTPSGVWSFVYKFHEISQASDITVPSSVIDSSDGGRDGNQKDLEEPEKNLTGRKDSGEKNLLPSDRLREESDEKLNDKVCDSERIVDVSETREAKGIQAQKGEILKVSDYGTGNENLASSNTLPNLTTEKGSIGSISIDESRPPEPEPEPNEHQQNRDSRKNTYAVESIKQVDNKDDEIKRGTCSHENVGIAEKHINTVRKEIPSELHRDEKRIPSFALAGGVKFTDASLVLPKKCPIGGCWKGYFENSSRRKDRMTRRVKESFHLFFNFTPPDHAKMTFDLDDIENGTDSFSKCADFGSLPPNYIQVRGAGNNQIGKFEMIGGYDPETNVLSCQRIYVSTTDDNDEKSDKKSKYKAKGTSSTPLRKSYSTRKTRPASLKKRSYGGNEVNTEIEGHGRGKSGGGGKKRLRVEVPTSKHDDSTIKNKATITTLNTAGLAPFGTPAEETKSLPMHVQEALPEAKYLLVGRRPSSGKITQAGRKSKSISQSNGKSSNSLQITIPKAGNAMEARWRSAHFLYYLRHAEGSETSMLSPSNSTPAPITPIKTNYVVIYEGEMNGGNNIRDGKGVCLYNNDMIYEGEWKRNKEHGRGSLFTGDRSQTIYEGDWERGKMHGRGTYYYHDETDLGNVGNYDGEFKENSRHGSGKYTFVDGSVYEGEWRDNVPSGKGIFRWRDKSVYEGNWKDGKRNGMGKLEAIDGFQYDGAWVNNAMEGKGGAKYPNGQEYDGMWLNGKRDGRGTIIFGNGAVYKGRFKDDCMEGQGTLEIENNVSVHRPKLMDSPVLQLKENFSCEDKSSDVIDTDIGLDKMNDWMIPIEFQSDIGHIHQKAGFTKGGE